MNAIKLIEIEMPQFNFPNIWVEETKTKEIAKIKEIIFFAKENKIEDAIKWHDLVEELFFDEDYNNTKKSIFNKGDMDDGIFGNCEVIVEIFKCRKGNYILEIDCQRENQCEREGITIINFDNKKDLINFLEQDNDVKYVEIEDFIKNLKVDN